MQPKQLGRVALLKQAADDEGEGTGTEGQGQCPRERGLDKG